MEFTELHLDKRIADGVAEAQFGVCTPMQRDVIAAASGGRDVVVRSPEGSGRRTALFIGALSRLLATEEKGPRQMMIVMPSRYGVNKVIEDARLIGAQLTLDVADGARVSAPGPESAVPLCRIFAGTPESLSGAIRAGKIDGRKISFLLVHEADRILDARTASGMFRLAKLLSPKQERQTLLDAKSFGTKVMDFIWEQMNGAAELDFSESRFDMSGVSQRLYHVSGQEKCSLLLGLARSEEPVLVFVNLRDTAYEITKRLETNGKKVVQLSRDSGRRSVLELIKKVKAGEVQFLVGTDGDAFGLYDSGIARIVNYDLPESGSDYTARFLKLALAGAQVRIDSFACERYVFNLERVEKFLGMKLPVERFEDSDLAEDKSDGMVFERERPEGRGRFDRRGPRDSSGRGDRRPGSPHRRSDQRSDRYDRGGDDRARRERVPVPEAGRDARRRTDEASGGERRERPERRGGGDRYAGDRGKRPEPRRDSPAERRPAGGISARPVSLRPASLRPEHEERRPEPHKKAATLDERIKQYHEKYGEDFKVSPDSMEEKKGLFGKIASLFKRKS